MKFVPKEAPLPPIIILNWTHSQLRDSSEDS